MRGERLSSVRFSLAREELANAARKSGELARAFGHAHPHDPRSLGGWECADSLEHGVERGDGGSQRSEGLDDRSNPLPRDLSEEEKGEVFRSRAPTRFPGGGGDLDRHESAHGAAD